MYRNKTGLFRNRKSDNSHFEPDEEVLQGEENDLNRTSLLTWTLKPVVTGVTLDITNNDEVKEGGDSPRQGRVTATARSCR